MAGPFTMWTSFVLLTGVTLTLSYPSSMGDDYPYLHDVPMGGGGGGGGAGETYHDMHMSDWNQDWAMLSGRLQQPNCVDIPANMTLCKGISYTRMRLPNLLEHDTLREATSQAAVWNHLLGIRCHPDTQIFLCSLFSPVCLERPIYPCRSLCQAVQAGCEGHMRKYKYPWPEMLRCDKFPVDNDLCITQVNPTGPSQERECPACNQPDTFEGIVDNFCSSEFVMKLKVEENVIVDRDVRITAAKKKKVYKKESLVKKDLRKVVAWLEGGAGCDCGVLDRAGDQEILLMGHKKGDRMVLSFVQSFDRKSHALRKALRAIRKEDICRVGLPLPTFNTEMEVDNTGTGNTAGEAEPSEKPKKKGKKKNRKNKDKGGEDKLGRKNRKRNKNRRRKGGRKDRKQRKDRQDKDQTSVSDIFGNTPNRQ